MHHHYILIAVTIRACGSKAAIAKGIVTRMGRDKAKCGLVSEASIARLRPQAAVIRQSPI